MRGKASTYCILEVSTSPGLLHHVASPATEFRFLGMLSTYSMGSQIANITSPIRFHLTSHLKDEMNLKFHLHQISYIRSAVSIWNSPTFLQNHRPQLHAFHTWLPDDYAVIFSHNSIFSTYKSPLTLHHKGVIAFSLSMP